MKPIYHVIRNTIQITKLLLLYLLFLVVLTLLFALFYTYLSVDNPFWFSLNVIWGSPDIPSSVSSLSIVHKIVYDVILVFLLGTFITQQIKPLNPLEFSKYIVYNDKEGYYSFRYWVILPQNSYFYNTSVRVIILENKEESVRGENRISSLFDKTWQYDYIRGVRVQKISGNDAKDLKEAVEKVKDKKDSIIRFFISGSNADGTKYFSIKSYIPNDIKQGYDFISIRDKEYVIQARSLVGCQSKRESKLLQDSQQNSHKEKIRFQHFDKLYRITNNYPKQLSSGDKDVLSRKQIIDGEFFGPKQWFIDLLSTICAHHLKYK